MQKEYLAWYRMSGLEGKEKWTVADCPLPKVPDEMPLPIVIQAGHPVTQEGLLLPIETVMSAKTNHGAIFLAGHVQYRDIFPDDPIINYDWCQRMIVNDQVNNVFSFFILRQDIH